MAHKRKFAIMIILTIWTVVLCWNWRLGYQAKQYVQEYLFNPETKDCLKRIRSEGIELINRGMEFMYPNIKIKGNYEHAVTEFYKTMTNDSEAFEKITKQLTKGFNDTDRLIEKGKDKFAIKEDGPINSTSLQKLLIYLYTTDSIYSKLNKVLRDHKCNNKSISDEDMYLAPYAAALTATLMNWKHLESTNETTYRGVHIAISHADSFIWKSFTSSSLDRDQALKFGNVTIYTTSNPETNAWQPKLIHEFSAKPNEKEALYPPGSVFIILHTDNRSDSIEYTTTSKNIHNKITFSEMLSQHPELR